MRLEKLEALRGFAAFYVVLHHTIAHSTMLFGFNIGILLRFGQEAVILFFLLSGFVINLSFQSSTQRSFRNYFTKRFLRIYLPLLVVFILGYLTQSYNNGKLINPDIANLFKNLLMLQDWDEVKPNVLAEPYMGNTPLWSLSYEWWFYMLYFPLVTYIKDNRFRDTFILILCVSAAITYHYYPNFINRLLVYLIIWWAGVQLSNLYIQKNLNLRGALWPLLSVATVMTILLISLVFQRKDGVSITFGYHPFLEFRHLASAIVMIVTGLLWRQFGWIGFNLLLRPFLILAPISYAIYISHMHIMVDATYLDWIENGYLKWFAYLGCLFLFSAIIELWFYPAVKRLIMNLTVDRNSS